MLRTLRSNRLLWRCSLLSCVIVGTAAVWSALTSSSRLDGVQTGLGYEFDLTTIPPTLLVPVTDETERQFRAEIVAEEIATTPLGSYVGITDDAGKSFLGTFLQRSPDNVELMNCLTRETVPGPHGVMQCRTSHVPLQSFPRSSITRFGAFHPPSPSFSVVDVQKDSSGVTVAEIVYRDGSRQRWGRPPETRASENAGDSLDGDGGVRPASFVELPTSEAEPR